MKMPTNARYLPKFVIILSLTLFHGLGDGPVRGLRLLWIGIRSPKGRADLFRLAGSALRAAEASSVDSPVAQVNTTLYEGLKEEGALMLIPSSAVESMGMGGLMGAAALQQQRLTGGGATGTETTDKTVSRKESQR